MANNIHNQVSAEIWDIVRNQSYQQIDPCIWRTSIFLRDIGGEMISQIEDIVSAEILDVVHGK